MTREEYQSQYYAANRIPLSKGGKHEIGNLALACAKCNLRKHIQTADEFIAQLQRTPTHVQVTSELA